MSTVTAYSTSIVGAGKDYAPEVVAYSGEVETAARAPSGPSSRVSRPFDPDARGGVSVAAAQIDGTTADNIIVGSGPGVPSEVRVYQVRAAVIVGQRRRPSSRPSARTVTIDRA